MIYISVKPHVTRLGNWMFQYAAAKSFVDGGDVAFVIERPEGRAAVEKCRALFPDVKIVASAPPGETVLEGLFQDVKYLKDDVMRGLFARRMDFAGRVPPGTVAIHVRRGDYLRLPHQHPFVGKGYLRRAISSFGPDARFLVFSDDLPWCRSFFTGPRFAFSEGRDAEEDLMLMSWCDHHICSNSTFSWWGAYLRRGGRTILPARWYGSALRQIDVGGLRFAGTETVACDFDPVQAAFAKIVQLKVAVGRVLRKLGLRQ